MTESKEQEQLKSVKQWVDQVVVGMNLCPFAKPVIKVDGLRYQLNSSANLDELRGFFLQELSLISQTTEQNVATSVLIIPNGLTDFYDYLDFLADCEALIAQAGLRNEFQLASFHPRYVFAGVEESDVSHWTNRSPFPIIHIIREQQMTRVLENHPNPDSIPARNVDLFRSVGKDELERRFPHFRFD